METKLAVPIILLAALIGVAVSLGDAQMIDDNWIQDTSDNDPENSIPDNVTHKHALFYVNANNTTLSFLEQEYQLAADRVHLENGRSHIVHKHREGVTWADFLGTINASMEHRNNSTYCGEIKNYSYCGEALVQLNGEKVTDLEKEIQQDDKLVIILQPDYEAWKEVYDRKELPDRFKEQNAIGRSI